MTYPVGGSPRFGRVIVATVRTLPGRSAATGWLGAASPDRWVDPIDPDGKVFAVPESRKRKKKKSSSGSPGATVSKRKGPSPAWYGWVTVVLLLLAVVWLISYTLGPVPGQSALGGWNYAVALVLLLGGVGMLTNWR